MATANSTQPRSNVIPLPNRWKHDAYISSVEIAEQAHLTHAWIMRSIKHYCPDFLEHCGNVQHVRNHIVLNVAQAWLFVGTLRNTEHSTRLKLKVTKDFIAAMNEVEQRLGYSAFSVMLGGRP